MRLININSAGRRRSQTRCPTAEALRCLQSKATLDAAAKDLAALIVFSLQEIAQGAEESAIA